MRLLKTLIGVIAIGFNTLAVANDAQALDAIASYSFQCNNKGGTAYLSQNHGQTWEVIPTAYFISLRKQALQMATINARLNHVDLKQLGEYILSNRPTIIKNMQQQRMIKCQ